MGEPASWCLRLRQTRSVCHRGWRVGKSSPSLRRTVSDKNKWLERFTKGTKPFVGLGFDKVSILRECNVKHTDGFDPPTRHTRHALLITLNHLWLLRIILRIKATGWHDKLRAVAAHGACLVYAGVGHVGVFALGVAPSTDALRRWRVSVVWRMRGKDER